MTRDMRRSEVGRGLIGGTFRRRGWELKEGVAKFPSDLTRYLHCSAHLPFGRSNRSSGESGSDSDDGCMSDGGSEEGSNDENGVDDMKSEINCPINSQQSYSTSN